MDTSTIVMILGIIFGPVIAYFAARRGAKADAVGKEQQNAIGKGGLLAEIEAITEKAASQASELTASKLNEKILEGSLKRFEDRWEKIVENNGYVRRSEELCNERLTALEQELRAQRPKLEMFGQVYDRVVRQAAELQKLHDQGVWQGDPSLLEAI